MPRLAAARAMTADIADEIAACGRIWIVGCVRAAPLKRRS